MNLVFDFSDGNTIDAILTRRSGEQRRRVPNKGDVVEYTLEGTDPLVGVVTNVQYSYLQKEGTNKVVNEVTVFISAL